ncbi:hypothetical protein V5P93_004209 [Actinokineospora auranticolor]|uniref:Uncharacterized protein n=1 Tax=Actinokineospora auranticolor TaxID=155976 RepID=A0A2S6GIR5_9PSEU|nr:hypothetical protein [Actinokineospora auranticolor]PPK65046.1 hypothetical protein CLV40_11689 [Actinokineospora auranticolor]
MITPITAVAIAVPARDEAEHIHACLRAIATAARGLPAAIAWSV